MKNYPLFLTIALVIMATAALAQAQAQNLNDKIPAATVANTGYGGQGDLACAGCGTTATKPGCSPATSLAFAQAAAKNRGGALAFTATPYPHCAGTYAWEASGGTITAGKNARTVRVKPRKGENVQVRLVFISECQNERISDETYAIYAAKPRKKKFWFGKRKPNRAALRVGLPTADKTASYNTVVVDEQGQVAMKAAINAKNRQIDTSTLPKGTYYLRLMQQGREVGTQRFVKE